MIITVIDRFLYLFTISQATAANDITENVTNNKSAIDEATNLCLMIDVMQDKALFMPPLVSDNNIKCMYKISLSYAECNFVKYKILVLKGLIVIALTRLTTTSLCAFFKQNYLILSTFMGE